MTDISASAQRSADAIQHRAQFFGCPLVDGDPCSGGRGRGRGCGRDHGRSRGGSAGRGGAPLQRFADQRADLVQKVVDVVNGVALAQRVSDLVDHLPPFVGRPRPAGDGRPRRPDELVPQTVRDVAHGEVVGIAGGASIRLRRWHFVLGDQNGRRWNENVFSLEVSKVKSYCQRYIYNNKTFLAGKLKFFLYNHCFQS